MITIKNRWNGEVIAELKTLRSADAMLEARK